VKRGCQHFGVRRWVQEGAVCELESEHEYGRNGQAKVGRVNGRRQEVNFLVVQFFYVYGDEREGNGAHERYANANVHACCCFAFAEDK
jgi:hypothetical protein